MISFKKDLKRNGFTLVELLIVIAIMSILTTITVGQFVTAQKKAHDVARKGDLSSLSKALMAYFADYGKFPPVDSGQNNIAGASWGGEFVDNGYVYMKVVPQENFMRNGVPQYCYVVSADQKSFALFAQLENTQDKDCKSPGYTHCGASYCYSVVSPNKSVGDFNGINP